MATFDVDGIKLTVSIKNGIVSATNTELDINFFGKFIGIDSLETKDITYVKFGDGDYGILEVHYNDDDGNDS